jgi:uncharacterized membrane protein
MSLVDDRNNFEEIERKMQFTSRRKRYQIAIIHDEAINRLIKRGIFMSKTKLICTYSMGVALYVALALCIQFPLFENYYLCLGYVAMAVYCYFFGPGAGAVVGGLGVVIYCLLTNGLRGMPGWALGNVIIGIAIGFTCKAVQKMKNKTVQQFIIALVVIVSTAIAMLLVKSGVECVLYAQPMVVRIVKNVYAFVADAAILIASFPLCLMLEPVFKRIFPELSAEF